jgi:general secretion pathway protein C
MSVKLRSVWWSRLLTFSLAAGVAASAVYWVLRWPQPVNARPVATAAAQASAADAQALTRLLGQAAVPAAAAPSPGGRYSLAGVLAGPGPRGAALISIDGKPAKPFRVGALVADNLYLQSVLGRRAVLAAGAADAPPSLTLEMKAPSR